MALQSKAKITYITRFLFAAMLLILASVSASAQDTNTFPGSGNAGIGTTTFDSGTSGLQIRPTSRSKFGVLVTDTDGSRAGTVVVLDTTKSNQVIASGHAYDTRVAGVISAQPGITLGESGEGKVLVATTGRVRVKVVASRAAIQIGDLLVTSDVAGVAMKSEAVNLGGVQIHRPGTIIGKALEPRAERSGELHRPFRTG